MPAPHVTKTRTGVTRRLEALQRVDLFACPIQSSFFLRHPGDGTRPKCGLRPWTGDGGAPGSAATPGRISVLLPACWGGLVRAHLDVAVYARHPDRDDCLTP